jgi:sulfur-oxidizing protein SoxY
MRIEGANMRSGRRQALQSAGGLALFGALVSLGLVPAGAQAQQSQFAAAFRGKGLAEALKGLGIAAPIDTREVTITAPDVADNGAVVPLTVHSKLPRTQRLALVVDRNPHALAGVFELEGVEPEISVEVKMAQSSTVVALAQADGKWYIARRDVQVTIGGCGV